jgi:hypothetical protein
MSKNDIEKLFDELDENNFGLRTRDVAESVGIDPGRIGKFLKNSKDFEKVSNKRYRKKQG